MACSDYTFTIYVDGVPLTQGHRKDSGCVGETHRFTVSTDLPTPINYKWILDGALPPISTNPYYDYTYDGNTHQLSLVLEGPSCGLGGGLALKGKICSTCPVSCTIQTVSIPPGTVVCLRDEANKLYSLEGEFTALCKNGANTVQAKAVKRAIREGTKCKEGALTVSIYNNQQPKNCLTLTINNSPVKFNSVLIHKTWYTFDKTKC